MPDSPSTPKRYEPRRVIQWMTRLGRHELALLVMLFCAVGSIWMFVELADEVMEGDVHGVDRRVLTLLRTPGDPSDPIGADWVEEFVRDITALGSFGVLTILTLAGCG